MRAAALLLLLLGAACLAAAGKQAAQPAAGGEGGEKEAAAEEHAAKKPAAGGEGEEKKAAAEEHAAKKPAADSEGEEKEAAATKPAADLSHEVKEAVEGEPEMHLNHSGRMVTCNITAKQPCPMAALSLTQPSLVFPGGETACLEGGRYAFRVYPGLPDKLLLYFQGGGACFEESTTMHHRMCKDGIAAHPNAGIFNRTDPGNPFKSYTVVQVIYCSGDIHAGNITQTYGGIVQHGYANAKATVEWAKANTAPLLTSFVIGGCSAGALGSQLWAKPLLGMFKYSSATVLLDSYIDLLPHVNVLLHRMGACTTSLFLPDEQKACQAVNLTVSKALLGAMQSYPNVVFAHLNSKADRTQQMFDNTVAQVMGMDLHYDDPSYFQAANDLLRRYNEHKNFISFVVGGDLTNQHCFLPGPDILMSTTVNGSEVSKDLVYNLEHEPLSTWIDALISRKSGYSDCFGERLKKGEWLSDSVKYCDEAQLPKNLDGALKGKSYHDNTGGAAPVTYYEVAGRQARAEAPVASLLLAGGVVGGMVLLLAAAALARMHRGESAQEGSANRLLAMEAALE